MKNNKWFYTKTVQCTLKMYCCVLYKVTVGFMNMTCRNWKVKKIEYLTRPNWNCNPKNSLFMGLSTGPATIHSVKAYSELTLIGYSLRFKYYFDNCKWFWNSKICPRVPVETYKEKLHRLHLFLMFFFWIWYSDCYCSVEVGLNHIRAAHTLGVDLILLLEWDQL